MTAGIALCVLLALCGVLLLVRLADHATEQPRNHLLIAAVAVLSGGIAYRFLDALQNLHVIRWSAAVGAAALLVFLLVDRAAQRARYTGPERRQPPRLGTDPDEDFPRPAPRTTVAGVDLTAGD